MSNVYELTKLQLYELGLVLAEEFLEANKLAPPRFKQQTLATTSRPHGSYGCGYYAPRAHTIVVTAARCAKPAQGQARQWSFPGYSTDRTPIGVVAHEVGHAVDTLLGYPSRDPTWQALCVKKHALTSYEPNPSESFAETMRLFITNPALLSAIRSARYAYLRHAISLRHRPTAYTEPLNQLRAWHASESILAAASNKVES